MVLLLSDLGCDVEAFERSAHALEGRGAAEPDVTVIRSDCLSSDTAQQVTSNGSKLSRSLARSTQDAIVVNLDDYGAA